MTTHARIRVEEVLDRERGELPIYEVGGWPRVRWSDVLAWVERARRGPDPPGSEDP